MKIICEYGYYQFFPENPSDLYWFQNDFGYDLVQYENCYTFRYLSELPVYSVKNQPYGNLTASITFCGGLGKILKANNFIYDILDNKLKLATDYKGELIDYKDFSGCKKFLGMPQVGYFVNKKRLVGFSGFTNIDFDNKLIILESWQYE